MEMEIEEVLHRNSKLKGFLQHGVLFTSISGNQLVGTCPFCGRSRKFYANVETRAWDCKRCGISGGFEKFLAISAKENAESLRGKPIVKLAKDRGLWKKTLRKWRVGWNGEFYTIPIDGTGKTSDLRRYEIGKKTMSTAGGKAGLLAHECDSDSVWICEGEWDAMACSEMLTKVKREETVFGVTGALNFPADSVGKFSGKNVFVVFDNDDAGIKGEQKVYGLLQGIANRVHFVHWPEEFPEGFDLRDLYVQENSHGKRTFRLLRKLLKDHPRSTAQQRAEEKEDVQRAELSGKGLNIRRVHREYRRWLHLPNVEVLSIVFGSVLANRLDGDPLWMFLVGPPGATKSEILMTLEDAPLIFPTSTLTSASLVSGANFATGGDPSLIPKLDQKVLVVKDFTVILNMHFTARDEIFGILRDAYDGRIEKIFGNGVWRKYESSFGILAGVTPVIETFSNLNSVLGERFLKYKVKQVGKINVGREMIERAISNINLEGSMRAELQKVAYKVLDRPVKKKHIPKIGPRMIKRLTGLAQWVAALRGVVSREKYTGEITFKPTAEIGTRLGKQLTKLAMGIAIFRRETRITEDVYKLVVKVARDTAPDRVEEIVKQLYLKADKDYVTTKEVAEWTRFPTATTTRLLQDLNLLHVVKREPGTSSGHWKLSLSIRRLIRKLKIYEDEERWQGRKKDA